MGSPEAAKTDREFAAEFFDETWALLAVKDRTKDQIERMIHCCHASFYHLDRVPDIGPKIRAKGYWQIARVYAAAGQGVVARTYAFRCMDEARLDGDPFLLTIACEVLGAPPRCSATEPSATGRPRWRRIRRQDTRPRRPRLLHRQSRGLAAGARGRAELPVF